MCDSKPGRNLPGPAVKTQRRPAARLAGYLDFEPVHTTADASAKSFCAGLFGCEARSQTFRGPALAQAIGLLSGGINAVQKTLTKALDGLLDPGNLDQIDTTTNNHPHNKLNHPSVRVGWQEWNRCVKAGHERFTSAQLVTLCRIYPIQAV